MSWWQWLGGDFGGNIAEWIGGVGTAGALLLGVLLFERERRDRRSAQARRIGSVLEFDGDELQGRVRIVNRSDLPLYDVQVITARSDEPGSASQSGYAEHGQTNLDPGEEKLARVDMVGDYFKLEAWIGFLDADGYEWYRRSEGLSRFVPCSKRSFSRAADTAFNEGRRAMLEALRASVAAQRKLRDAMDRAAETEAPK